MLPSRNSTPARPAPLACMECRKVHLKCDAARPTCGRCTSRGFPCIYTTSKRGRRRAVHAGHRTEAINSPSSPQYRVPSPQTVPAQGTDEHHALPTVEVQGSTGYPVQSELASLSTRQIEQNSRQFDDSGVHWIDDIRLVNLYYLNFHPNHPILLSRSLYWERAYPWVLKAVVEFIGSHFSEGSQSRTLSEDIIEALDQGRHEAPTIVQAQILYATFLLAQNEGSMCQRVLGRAVDSAIRMNMHRREFAASYAPEQPLEAESLRRTWYELYILDGCVAACQRNAQFKADTVSADVLLPCEDNLYENGGPLPIPASRDEFEASTFMEEEIVFPSFAYRIEAVRLLGRVLTITGKHSVQRERVQAIDNALAAFLLHLPTSKREANIVKTSGDIDVLMLQTHMIIQYSTILLHFSRSDLAPPGPIAAELPGDSAAKFICPCTRQHVHSVKAIDASRAISMLAALRIPAQKHTPLTIYPLVLCAVVQLSICITHKISVEILQQHRDCVKLILGVLKSMSQRWSTAGMLLRALQKRALRIFRVSQNPVPESLEQETLGDDTFFLPQVDQADIGSEDILQLDFDTLLGFNGLLEFDNNFSCL